jgi:hypothetical protein
MFKSFAGGVALIAMFHSPSVFAQSALEMDRDALVTAYQLRDEETMIIYGDSGCATVINGNLPSGDRVMVTPKGTKITCVNGLADGVDDCGQRFEMGMGLPSSVGIKSPDQWQVGCWMRGESSSASAADRLPVYQYSFNNRDVSVGMTANSDSISNVTEIATKYDYQIDKFQMAGVYVATDGGKLRHDFGIGSEKCDKFFKDFPQNYEQEGRSGEYFRKASELCANIDWGKRVATVHSISYNQLDLTGVRNDLPRRRFICAITGKIEAAAQKSGFSNECSAVWEQQLGPFLTRINAAWQNTREREAQRDARIADLRQNFASRYGALIQQKAQGEQAAQKTNTELAAIQSQQRIASFRSANSALFSGTAAAANSFIKPTNGSDAFVLLIGDNGNGPMSLSVDRMVLQEGDVHDVDELDGVYDKAAFEAAIANAKISGAKALYVVYLDRAFAWEGPVAATPETITAYFKKPPQANPEYASWVAELKVARGQLAAAQGDYDRTYSTTMRKSESGDIEGAAMGLITSLGASSDLSRAERRVAELEALLAKTDKTITETEWLSFRGVKTKYRLDYNAQLAIYACDIASGLCAEKERPVTGTITADRYPVYFSRAEGDTYRFVERDAQKILYGTIDKKRAFGLTADAIGTFANGAKLQIPLSALAKYITFADADAKKQFKARMAENEAAFTAIAPQLVETGDKASAQNYADVGGMIAAARKRIKRTELQGL